MRQILIISIIILLSACVERFFPNIERINNYLVVDSKLSNIDLSHVRLTQSSAVNKEDSLRTQTVENADVFVEIQGAENISFEHDTSGYYYPEDLNFKGQSGISYRLNISLNGQRYQSTWEEMRTPSNIDNIHYQIKNVTDEPVIVEELELDILIDASGNDDANYLKWEYEETWKYTAQYEKMGEYIGDGDTIGIPVDARTYMCYRNNNSKDIIIQSLETLSDNKIEDQILLTINNRMEKLSIRYSILLKQYSLNESTFLYWQQLEESTENLGSLFDPQTGPIQGNISNLSNSEDLVLGNFNVYGGTEIRYYLDRRLDLGNDFIVYRPKTCIPDSIFYFEPRSAYDAFLFGQINNFIVYYNPIEGFFGSIIGHQLLPRKCIDCTLSGGTLKEPDFWLEKEEE